MTKEDLQWLEEYLRCEAAEYLEKVVVTPEERHDILEWVKSGNSVYGNPWYLADERGYPMDYIAALRVVYDLH